ncbi:CHAT domain-containing protein [Sphingomonas sp.]|uniref:CHAT domain-containing protein n=1 Tax=Sphingomonas sp. TaxID=28214 RepID=UPI003D6D7B0F
MGVACGPRSRHYAPGALEDSRRSDEVTSERILNGVWPNLRSRSANIISLSRVSDNGGRPIVLEPNVRNPDPLKITYIIAQGEDRLDDMSPFQGFGRSWGSTLWALRLLAVAPASILERSWPLDGLIAQRMGGANSLAWLPLMVSALEQLALDELGFVTVVLSGSDAIAKRVDAWCAAQPRPVLHVRHGEIADEDAAIAFCDIALREHISAVLEAHGAELSEPRRAAAMVGLEQWMRRERVPLAVSFGYHNLSTPNEMVFERADRLIETEERFVGSSEEEYDEFVVESVQAVLDLRDEIGFRDFNRLYLPRPGLILTEPAFYRPAYARTRGDREITTKPMLDTLRRLQQQKGLWNTIESAQITALMEDPKAGMLLGARQEELAIQTYGVGLMAAQTCSAVMRLRPAVNHVFPTLSRYARNIRAVGEPRGQVARLKTPRLFDDLQRELAAAVGAARIELIMGYRGAIKIVADAPIELLPIGDLPLAMRHDTSRINATPGNLMMGELVGRMSATLSPAELCKVLVISGFAENDRLRNLMARALETIAPDLVGRVEHVFIRARSRGELVAALNASEATILIFDGHGVAGGNDGIGGIIVGKEQVNVWELRGEARIPPIVILSACDTQGLDAPNHATVGNGFIAAGAVTVLATMLPVGGVDGAVFIARLLYRLAVFLPAFMSARLRSVDWCEVVAGMLRMVLASETTDGIVADPAASAEIKRRANMDINSGDPDWYAKLLTNVQEVTALEEGVVRRKARAIMARSEAIRYIQLGSPEAITIDDGGIAGQFFPPGSARLPA